MSTRFLKGLVVAATAGIGASVLAPMAATAAVACGQTITASMTLDQDLTCPGTAIFVNNDGVVLNLAGHTISGPVPSGGTTRGIQVTFDHHGVTIANGIIRGFDVGVQFGGRADGTVTGLTLDANGGGIFTQTDSSGSRIAGNTIVNTTQFSGVQLGGSRHTVEGNTFSMGHSTAVFLSGNENVIRANRISEMGAAGITVGAFPSNPGPFVHNQVVGNTISGSGRIFNSSSISITNGSGTSVQGNTVTGRRATPGVFVLDSADTVVSTNYLTNNSTGVLVRGASTNTQLLQNRADQNNFSGLAVESVPTGTLVSGNVAMRSGGNGIDVRSPATTVTGNTAVLNTGYGIFAVPGVTDGGGNRAYGNGQPAQCTPNIRCA
jgi:parallel beta-helix repeat protein